MAHRVIDDTQEEPVQKTKEVIEKVVHSVKTRVPIVLDALVLLTIAFWYFFWTGIALVLGRQIPKEWLKIATRLSKDRLSKKIANPAVKKPGFRVVDLETQQPVPIP